MYAIFQATAFGGFLYISFLFLSFPFSKHSGIFTYGHAFCHESSFVFKGFAYGLGGYYFWIPTPFMARARQSRYSITVTYYKVEKIKIMIMLSFTNKYEFLLVFTEVLRGLKYFIAEICKP